MSPERKPQPGVPLLACKQCRWPNSILHNVTSAPRPEWNSRCPPLGLPQWEPRLTTTAEDSCPIFLVPRLPRCGGRGTRNSLTGSSLVAKRCFHRRMVGGGIRGWHRFLNLCGAATGGPVGASNPISRHGGRPLPPSRPRTNRTRETPSNVPARERPSETQATLETARRTGVSWRADGLGEGVAPENGGLIELGGSSTPVLLQFGSSCPGLILIMERISASVLVNTSITGATVGGSGRRLLAREAIHGTSFRATSPK